MKFQTAEELEMLIGEWADYGVTQGWAVRSGYYHRGTWVPTLVLQTPAVMALHIAVAGSEPA